MILFAATGAYCTVPENMGDIACHPAAIAGLLAIGGGLVFAAVVWALLK